METQSVEDIVNTLPDNIDLEDIMYELYVKKKVEKSLKNMNLDNTISLEEWKKTYNL